METSSKPLALLKVPYVHDCGAVIREVAWISVTQLPAGNARGKRWARNMSDFMNCWWWEVESCVLQNRSRSLSWSDVLGLFAGNVM